MIQNTYNTLYATPNSEEFDDKDILEAIEELNFTTKLAPYLVNNGKNKLVLGKNPVLDMGEKPETYVDTKKESD